MSGRRKLHRSRSRHRRSQARLLRGIKQGCRAIAWRYLPRSTPPRLVSGRSDGEGSISICRHARILATSLARAKGMADGAMVTTVAAAAHLGRVRNAELSSIPLEMVNFGLKPPRPVAPANRPARLNPGLPTKHRRNRFSNFKTFAGNEPRPFCSL